MDESRLLESLARYGRRLRWKRVAESTLRAIRVAAVLSLLSTLGLKAWGLEVPTLAWGLLPLAVIPAAVALLVGARRLPPVTVAAAMDQAHDLQERLSTAVEWIVTRRPQTLMSRAQLQDALRALDGVPPGEAFPVRLPRAWGLPLLVLPALLGLCALPPWHFFAGPADAIDVGRVSAEARKIESSAQELTGVRKASRLPAAERQRLARQLQALARALSSGRTSRRQAMADLAASREALQKALQELRERMASREAPRTSPSAAPSPGQGAPAPATAGASTSDRLRSLAERARGQKPGSDARSLAREMERLAQDGSSDESVRRALEEARRAVEQGRPGEAASRLEQEAQDAAAVERESARDRQAMEEGLEQVERASGQLADRGEGEGREAGRGTAQPGGEEIFREGGPPPESSEATGKVAPDFGVGTSHREAEPKGAATPRHTFVKRQSQERSRWTEAWRRLYQARRTAVTSGVSRVRGRASGGPTTATGERVRAAGRAGDRSILDERAVYEDSRRRAEESVARSSIPQEYRELVRNYFEDIDPRERGR